MLKIDDNLRSRITNMTFVCTLIILYRHLPSAGVYVPMYFLGIDYTGIAVPSFFAISGYLIGIKSDSSDWYLNLLRKRFKTLVVPYFAINTALIPAEIIYNCVLKLGNWPGDFQINWYAISRIYGLTTLYHPASGPLWYVRCLIFFVLLSPIIVCVVRKSTEWACVLIVSLLVLISYIETTTYGMANANLFYSFFNIRGLVLFSGGIAISYWGKQVEQQKRFMLASFLLIFGIVFAKAHLWLSFLSQVLLVASLWFYMPTKHLAKWLATSCFTIYAFHEPIYLMHKSLLRLLDIQINGVFWAEPILLALAICCGFRFLVERYCPKVGVVFLGGRC